MGRALSGGMKNTIADEVALTTYTIQACGDDSWQEQAASLPAMKAILAGRSLADAGYEPSDKGMKYDIYDEDRSEFFGTVRVVWCGSNARPGESK